MSRLTGRQAGLRLVPLVLVLVLVLVPSGRCRPQSSSEGHPGGYHSTLLQYLSGVQQELPADRRPSPQQQRQLAEFLRTQQQQRRQQTVSQPQQQQFSRPQQQQLSRPQQQQFSRPQQQQFSRPQQQQFSRPQQQQQFSRPQQQQFDRFQSRPFNGQTAGSSLGRSTAPVTPVRPAPSAFRRPGGAIIFPGPVS